MTKNPQWALFAPSCWHCILNAHQWNERWYIWSCTCWHINDFEVLITHSHCTLCTILIGLCCRHTQKTTLTNVAFPPVITFVHDKYGTMFCIPHISSQTGKSVCRLSQVLPLCYYQLWTHRSMTCASKRFHKIHQVQQDSAGVKPGVIPPADLNSRPCWPVCPIVLLWCQKSCLFFCFFIVTYLRSLTISLGINAIIYCFKWVFCIKDKFSTEKNILHYFIFLIFS